VGSIPLLTPRQSTQLPDLTANLNWCDWKGAITDVFSLNARQWPYRPCVIQSFPATTLDEPQEKQAYTYSTIRRVSNILAHHLLQGGIQREEVVMVYAYRSVELVAITAILKAGAIFSIIGSLSFIFISGFLSNLTFLRIDPAYPPSRQTVYLQVARPRGLIILKSAGSINPSVRDFISTELLIRVEVPALEHSRDGKHTWWN
jgi:L-aminoadipate-semialdehyde dehydrogenase